MAIDSFRISTIDNEWFVYTDGHNFDVTYCTCAEFAAFEKNPETGIQARYATEEVVIVVLNLLMDYLNTEPDPSVSSAFFSRTRAIETQMKTLPEDFTPPPNHENNLGIEWHRKPSPGKYNAENGRMGASHENI